MAQQSHLLNIPNIQPRLFDEYSYCRKTICVMKYSHKSVISKISAKPTPFMKKAAFSILAITISIYQFSPETAHAGLLSFISDLTSDEVSAKTVETSSTSNSQNMLLLEAAINADPNPHKIDSYSVLAYNNALQAEIGPQGTLLESDNKVSNEISLYTVKNGDTIAKIADMFDVSVNTIIWANELGKTPSIKEGQLLVILPISGIKYTVKKGDTIKGIVYKYKSNLEEVLQYNDLTLSSNLTVGSVIIIPDAEPSLDVPKIAQVRKTSGTTSVAHDTKGAFYPGYYIKPISGGTKSQGLHGYNAVDLAAPVGTVIRASAAGKVISSISNGAWNGGYGNYVIIAHDNGTQTLYAHTQKNFVVTGDIVEQGEMIAKIGMTGKTSGPHVHFEIRGAKNHF